MRIKRTLLLNKCASKQEAKVKLGNRQVARDAHALPRKCTDKEDCDLRVHAVEALVAYVASTEHKLKGKTVYLRQVPCDTCAKLLMLSRVGKLVIEEEPQDEDDEHVWELMAVRIPLRVGPVLSPDKWPQGQVVVPKTTPAKKTPRIGLGRGRSDSGVPAKPRSRAKPPKEGFPTKRSQGSKTGRKVLEELGL